MKTQYCKKRYVLVLLILIILATFVGLHYKQYGFTKPTAKTLLRTLSDGFNKTKQYIAGKSQETADMKIILLSIANKLNQLIAIMEVPKNVSSLSSDEQKSEISLRELDNIILDVDDTESLQTPESVTMNDKWIVVTSECCTVSDAKVLANIPGWKLVIVQNTIAADILKYPGVVIFSIQDQQRSGFETARFMKHGVHQRKNLGYLYAIQHGAKIIYDTEFDSFASNITRLNIDGINKEKEYLVYNGNEQFYNSLAHFGQNALWPRGYPLHFINETPTKSYSRCKNVRAPVHHGIAKGNPDLDAIQRLTMRGNDNRFDKYFDTKAPPVILSYNSFAPYNSQNTFHRYDAFFSLLLPQTVTSRVGDIWRSFITQRLLWDIGSHISLIPTKSYHKQKPRNLIKELHEEEDLYRNSKGLTDLLINWKVNSNNIFTRYFDVIKTMYKEGMIGGLDVRLARAWIKDLLRIGYISPQIQSTEMTCKPEKNFMPKEMMTVMQPNKEYITEYLKLLDTDTTKSPDDVKSSTTNPAEVERKYVKAAFKSSATNPAKVEVKDAKVENMTSSNTSETSTKSEDIVTSSSSITLTSILPSTPAQMRAEETK